MRYLIAILIVLLPAITYGKKVSGRSQTRSVTITPPIPRPKAPAILQIANIRFVDTNNNKLIDAEENCYVNFDIINKGSGSAYAVTPVVKQLSNIEGVVIAPGEKIKELTPGEKRNVSVNVRGEMGVQSSEVLLSISVIEGNGFDASKYELAINTLEFQAPNIVVVDNKFTTLRGGSRVYIEEVITVQTLVQNRGVSVARNVELDFVFPDENNGIVVTDPDKKKAYIGELKPGESKVLSCNFLVNSRYNKDNIPVNLTTKEYYGRYGSNATALLELNKPISKDSRIVVEGVYAPAVEIAEASLVSDVDRDIPLCDIKRDNVFALVVGNEEYSRGRTSGGEDANVRFARNDASVFADYLEKTLGVPHDNIILMTDMTKAQMEVQISRVCNMVKSSTHNNNELIFYYAGHGLCDDEKQSYLIPTDIPGTHVEEGIKLCDLYSRFGELPKTKTTAFVDACFSGGARNGELLAARGVKVEPKKDAITGSVVVFSAASGNEAALPYEEKQHGMFTYFLLKKIQYSSGRVSYDELSKYIRAEVVHNSYKINNASQTPTTLVSVNLIDDWEAWKLL